MSGLGVLAWLVIGSAVGWVVSRLMVLEDDDALRGTAAGIIGALLGGLGMRMVEWSPAIGATQLNTLAAVLAGSLWLTWITCVVTSGRERRPETPLPELHLVSPDAAPSFASARRAATYAAARVQLVDQLRRDAVAHDAERYDEVGQRFGTVGRVVPHGSGPELVKLRIAVTFWGQWIDARDRGWRRNSAIAKGDWPQLARTLAADLEGDRNVTDRRLVLHFDAGSGSLLGNRVQTLVARMRTG
jgi:uncharacterized membrane protein YeaQ/YmgE (transglycosylase-associated protein family)